MSGTETPEEAKVKPRSAKPFDSESGRKAAMASVASRRAKAKARAETAEENALTARQRLGVALSKLTQREWDAKVKAAKAHELVRFLDQAFGRPTDAEPDKPEDTGLAALTKDQRAALRAMLTQDEPLPGDPVPQEIHAREPEQEDPPPPRASESRES